MRLFPRPRNTSRLPEAKRAREKAERDLEQTRAETPRYRALAREFIEIREINHLGESAARVLRGEK